MKDDPLVSVIIPVFNAEKFIAECLDSVLGQTYKNYEVIVIDDGSTDKSIEIIESFQSDRVKIYSQENSGQGMARNLGVEKALGEWIAFIDSDDNWFAEKLEMQLEHCSNFPWSHTDYYFIGDVLTPNTRSIDFVTNQSGHVFDKLIVENTICTSTVMIKKTIFQELGGFNTSYRALQDWDLWLRVSKKYEIGFYGEPLGGYRIHSSSVSRSTRKNLPYHIEIINRIFSDDEFASENRHLKKNALSQSCQICSQISEQEGDYYFAIVCALRALFYRPLLVSRYTRLVKIIVKSIWQFTLKPLKS